MRITNQFLTLALLGACAFLTSCESANSNTVKVYQLGSKVEAGHLLYTVYETQWLPQIGAGDSARVPKKRFFLVRFSAVNSGSEELYVPNLTLLDDQGNTVEELQDGDQVPQWVGFVRKAKPADSVSGNIVFDTEPKHYRLKVTDENGDKPGLIDIPLNFNADAPPAPLTGATGGASDFNTPIKK
jgi:hypothetical protein